MFKQNAVINSYNINLHNEVNTDITLYFNPELFRKKPHKLDLIHFSADPICTLFGNTNNAILVTITDDLNLTTTYTIEIENCVNVKTDEDLAIQITRALNGITYNNYVIEFFCFAMFYEQIITNVQIEQEDYTSTFSLLASNYCTISFNHKDSIGPLIGYGYGSYEMTPILGTTGIHVPSIFKYNYIKSYNDSGYIQQLLPGAIPDPQPLLTILNAECAVKNENCFDRGIWIGPGDAAIDPEGGGCEVVVAPVYINYFDKNCKMLLYDSDNNLIQHNNYPGLDTTISLHNNINSPIYYDKIYNLLRNLEIELNRYITYFTPYALFEVTYDYTNNKVTINNRTGAKFGIGFDLLSEANIVSTGSLHKALGFDQKSYLGVTSITSTTTPLIFEHTFSEDYIYILSDDLIYNLNPDINVFSVGNGQHVNFNDILYAIPLSKSNCFSPNNEDTFSVELYQSKLTYFDDCNQQKNETEPISVNFYFRLKSGRHCKMIKPYSMIMNIEYDS
jgi:hypothetical protein